MLIVSALLALAFVLALAVPVQAEPSALPATITARPVPDVLGRVPSATRPQVAETRRPNVVFPATRPVETGERVRGLLLLLFGLQRSSGER